MSQRKKKIMKSSFYKIWCHVNDTQQYMAKTLGPKQSSCRIYTLEYSQESKKKHKNFSDTKVYVLSQERWDCQHPCVYSFKSDRLPSFSGMGRGSEWLWMVMPGRREGEQLTARARALTQPQRLQTQGCLVLCAIAQCSSGFNRERWNSVLCTHFQKQVVETHFKQTFIQ